MSTQAERRARVTDILGDDFEDPHDSLNLDDLNRFLLVERSRFDSGLFLTTWSDPGSAADYHDGQEYPDDWIIDALYDLDSGQRIEAATVTEWVEA